MAEARKHGVNVLPVDNEHSAIFQCLDGRTESVRRLILTARAGHSANASRRFRRHHGRAGLKHPSWVMGARSPSLSTMFNQGLEMIEARWLFNIPMPQVDVIVLQRGALDGRVRRWLHPVPTTPDMCLPIQYALTWPSRAASERVQTDFAAWPADFEARVAIPALGQARRAGGERHAPVSMPQTKSRSTPLRPAHLVRRNRESVTEVMDRHQVIEHPTLDEIIEADQWAHETAATWWALAKRLPDADDSSSPPTISAANSRTAPARCRSHRPLVQLRCHAARDRHRPDRHRHRLHAGRRHQSVCEAIDSRRATAGPRDRGDGEFGAVQHRSQSIRACAGLARTKRDTPRARLHHQRLFRPLGKVTRHPSGNVADLSPAEITRLIDFGYLDEVLTVAEAVELLQSHQSTRAEREGVLKPATPATTHPSDGSSTARRFATTPRPQSMPGSPR